MVSCPSPPGKRRCGDLSYGGSGRIGFVVDRIQSVFFYVSDMERAVAFYEDLLGLRLVERGDEWSALDCGGVRLGLHRSDAPPGGESGAVVSFRVADAAAAVERLRAGGANVGDVQREPFGLLVHLEDPDGNALRLVQPS
jgi:catechol 2,3-dioxygenase-like lactoylglutathione lyase family enzyme